MLDFGIQSTFLNYNIDEGVYWWEVYFRCGCQMDLEDNGEVLFVGSYHQRDCAQKGGRNNV